MVFLVTQSGLHATLSPIDGFQELELKVGLVLAAQRVMSEEGSYWVLSVDLGALGVANAVAACLGTTEETELRGKTVVCCACHDPVDSLGVGSYWRVLRAQSGESLASPIFVDMRIQPGARIR